MEQSMFAQLRKPQLSLEGRRRMDCAILPAKTQNFRGWYTSQNPDPTFF
jgi:hypothetical protein